MTADWPRKIRRASRAAGRAVEILTAEPLTIQATSRDKRALAHVRSDGEDEHGAWFRFEVQRLGVPKTLRIVPETAASLVWQHVKGADVRVGDPKFDAAANLSGPAAWILAALNVRAREQLLALLEQGGRVEAERIRVRLRIARPHQLVSQTYHLLKLARRLSLPDLEVTRVLIRRAQNAGSAQKRRAAVAGLIEHAPYLERFRDLARIDAHLAQGTEAERSAGRRLRLAWLTGDPDRVMRAPESWAIDALEAPIPTRLAAIERLGQVGTARSIAPLTAAARGFFTSTRVKSAARRALEAVVTRVGEVAAGGLALTEDATGHLALKD